MIEKPTPMNEKAVLPTRMIEKVVLPTRMIEKPICMIEKPTRMIEKAVLIDVELAQGPLPQPVCLKCLKTLGRKELTIRWNLPYRINDF